MAREKIQMNKYIGKICPFCKTEFKEGDDIVVCSTCDMPHHKDCWIENQGCTTFGCLGTIKSADEAVTSVTENEMSYDDIIPVEIYFQEETDTDVYQLIGTNSEYYVPRFQEIKNQKRITSWNWVAFWVTPYWFIYRKMYAYGYGILGAELIINFIPGLSSFSIGGNVALGIFANYIYMKHLENKAQVANSMSEPFKKQYVLKNSGTNILATILTIIGYEILVALLST